jgi:hypothetical protein
MYSLDCDLLGCNFVVRGDQGFGGTFCLHLHFKKYIYLEEVGRRFLRNVSNHRPDYNLS